MRVLILEDDPGDTELIQEHIKRYWRQHIPEPVEIQASSGLTIETTQAVVEKYDPDVIIADHYLPGRLSWPVVFHELRKYTDVPVITISGKASEDSGLAAIRLGADDYISKKNLDRLPLSVYRAHITALAMKEHRQASSKLLTTLERKIGGE